MTTASQSQAALLRRLANTLYLLLTILALALIVFWLAYWTAEDYGGLRSLHWAMQTMTTTGYGDVPPQTTAGVLLSVALQPLAVVTTLLLGANFIAKVLEDPNAFTHEEQVEARRCDDDTNAKVTQILAHLTKENT